MIVNLEPIFNNDGFDFPFDYSFQLEESDDFGSIHVSGDIFNKTGIVRLCGVAQFEYDTVCALCNKEITRKAKVKINHFLTTHLENDDNDMYVQLDETQLNLDELITEDIWLSLPSRFLCKNDCKGLCPQCGADLNDGSCGCVKQIDPRLSALADLLNES